ncbi:MAG: T9SS type A sorting domain-containing protein [Spirosomataceae bacterium]
MKKLLHYLASITGAFMSLTLLHTAALAQTTLLSESFETDGEGTRYTSNTFSYCSGSPGGNPDYFLRTNTNPVLPTGCAAGFGSTLTNLQGSYFWASEDIRSSSPVVNGRPPGDITFNTININGYVSLQVSLYLATASNNGIRWEDTDKINIKVSMNGGTFNTVGRFMGDAVAGGRLRIDSNLDGVIDANDVATTCDQDNFAKYTFTIPYTGSTMQLKLEFDQIGGTEELAIDLIEVTGVYVAPDVFWVDDFENATAPSSGTRTPQANAGFAGTPAFTSYFKRTDGSDISLATPTTSYSGKQGTYFWAGEDHDASASPTTTGELNIVWDGINIAGKSGLSFQGLFGANSENGSWDNFDTGSSATGFGVFTGISNDYLIVDYAIDGGAYTQLMAFFSDNIIGPIGTAKRLLEDTDGNYIGNGTVLTRTLTDITKPITGTGSTLKIRIRVYSNGGSEEWAIDNFRLLETTNSCSLTVTAGTSTPSVCVGQNISLTVTAGDSYTWAGPTGSNYSSSTQNPSATASSTTFSGVYSVTVSSAGCTASSTVSVSVNGLPNGSITPSSPTVCSGTSITLTAGGGSTYTWAASGGSFTSTTGSPTTWSGVAGGYTITVTVSNGTCSNTATTTLSVNTVPTAGISLPPPPYCAGVSINLTGTGGSSYSWASSNSGFVSTTGSSPGWSSLSGGSYSVTVTSGNGTCTASATASMSVNSLPNVGITTSTATVCLGTSINLTATGASSYTWSGTGGSFSSTTNAISSWSGVAGGYTLTVVGNNGTCNNTATATVSVNGLPNGSITPSSPTVCSGTSITLTAGGGSTYTWAASGGSFTSTTGSPTTWSGVAGGYTITVTVSNGTCSNTATTTLSVNTVPTAGISLPPPPYCAGVSINLTGTGGSSYSWASSNSGFVSTTGSSPGWSSLSGGSYSVTVTSGNGTCTASATASMSVNSLPNVGITTSTATVCLGTSINLTATGASSYTWSGTGGSFSSTTNAISSWSGVAGGYTLTVVGNNGTCNNTATATVSVNGLPNGSITPSSPTVCSGTSITLTAGGGSTYTWAASGGSFTSTTGSPTTWSGVAGGYTITVTVSNGTCSNTATTTLSVNTVPTAGISLPPPPYCAGVSINLTGTGGSSYSWASSNSGFVSTTGSSPGWSSLSGGSYSVTVTSGNGTCTASATASMSVNSLPNVGITTSTATVCLGTSINLTATGASSYTWSGTGGSFSSTTNAISSWSGVAGGYTLTVVGNNGTCNNTATATVSVNGLPNGSITPSSPTVCSGTSITLTAGGGSTYTWAASGGSFTSTTGSPTTWSGVAGGYTITVTVSNGTCSNSTSATVRINALPSTSLSVSQSQVCVGQSIGLTASGGSSYRWSSSGGTFTSTTNALTSFSSSSSSSYTISVSVSNSVNCSATASVSVQYNTSPSASISPSTAQSICVGTSLSLTASGGSVYSWRGPNGFSSNSAMASVNTSSTANSGGYSVTVGNAGNCTATASLQVTISQAIAQVNPSSQSVCVGGTVSLSSVGTGSYSWRGPNNFSSSVQNVSFNLSSSAQWGIYSLTVVSGGCSASTSAEVKQGTVQFGSNSPVCVGGTLQFTASGGGAVYSWYRPTNNFSSSQQNPVIQNVKVSDGGLYFVSVSGSGGCTGSGLLQVMIINTPIDVSFSVSPSSICWGSTVTLSASSGTGSSYSWSGPNGFSGNTRTKSIGSMGVQNEGMYRLTVKSGQCWGYSEKEVRINCASRLPNGEEEIDIDFNAYPNPTNKLLIVEVKLREPSSLQLQLINPAGQPLNNWNLAEESTIHHKEIDLSAYKDGIYFIQVQSKDGKQTKRVVKME